MDSKEGFDGKRGDDGLHHGVPFLSPDAAGAAGLGLCAGALALLVFEDGLPHIAGRFADLADWHEALAEAFGDFDLDEGKTPRTYILYVPARRREDHYEVWPMPDGLMVL